MKQFKFETEEHMTLFANLLIESVKQDIAETKTNITKLTFDLGVISALSMLIKDNEEVKKYNNLIQICALQEIARKEAEKENNK